MWPERGGHAVVADRPALLEALAPPFGTYDGVAVCRAVPGTRSLEAMAVDLLCALGKTEALSWRGRLSVELVELWLRAHRVRSLFVTGADGVGRGVWRELCDFGGRVGCEVVFVSAEPARRQAELPEHLALRDYTYLRTDPDGVAVPDPVGAMFPDVGFPALPAACAQFLEPHHAARAQTIYNECLVSAFHALPYDTLLEQAHADGAFRAALARSPDLDAVPLAIHALRAAGLLRGYEIRVVPSESNGVAFDALLTADRLKQLSTLLSADQAAAGVLYGLAGHWPWTPMISPDGTSVRQGDIWQRTSDRIAALLRAWALAHPDHVGQWPVAAPARTTDGRRRLLWRTPPPEYLRVECRMIDCRSFRLIADPPMEWVDPPRPRRRNGPARSAHSG